jgi:hypothetical protein
LLDYDSMLLLIRKVLNLVSVECTKNYKHASTPLGTVNIVNFKDNLELNLGFCHMEKTGRG